MTDLSDATVSDPCFGYVVLAVDYIEFFPKRRFVQSGIKVWPIEEDAWEYIDQHELLGCKVYKVRLSTGWDHGVVFERGDHRLKFDSDLEP